MKIHKATYLISSPNYDQCLVLEAPEYAFIGRSNVGKSSIINAICGQKGLAKTSSAPGKTQLINHFEIISNEVVKGRPENGISSIYLDMAMLKYPKVVDVDGNK